MSKVRARSFFPLLARRTSSAAFAAALLAGSAAPAATEVWTGVSSGNWSSAINWEDFTPPAAGGNATQAIRFTYTGASAATFTNDLTGTYVLNQLLLEMSGTGAATLAGNALQFSGAAPTLSLGNTTGAIVSENLVLNPTSGSVTISGSGPGGVNLSGIISETGGARSLVVAASPDPLNLQTVTLSGANTFTGGVRLQSGNLLLSNTAALGTGTLTVQGGTVKVGTFSYNNNIALEQRMLVQGASSFINSILNGVISSSVAGTGVDVRLDSSSLLTLNGASTYNGSTTLDRITSSSNAGQLLLINGGSILNSPTVTVSSFGTLSLSSGGTNRLGDSAEIILRGGQLSLTHTFGGTAFAETFGTLTGAGSAIVSVVTTTTNLRLQASSLNRLERGTFRFVGSSLGSAFGSGVGNILFTATPAGLAGGGGTGTSTSILPYATSTESATSVTGFATYSATTGIRRLNDATEYVTNFATAPATANVLLTAGLANDSAQTINSLTVRGGHVSGAGAITLASGALLVSSTGTTTVANDLVLGAQEGFIHAFSPVQITGAISGSNGLTIGGATAGTVELTGNNTFTGPLTINSGQLIFSIAGALGAGAAPLVIGNHNVGFSYKGADALTIARPLETRTGTAYLENLGGELTLAAISGGGGLRFGGSSRFNLAEGSNYTGPTTLGTSTVQISADSAFGSGGTVDFGGGKVVLAGPWAAARDLSVSASSTLDTGGFNATWNGALSGTSRLTKTGIGELNLTKAVTYSGPVTISGGTLRLSDAGAVRSTGFSAVTINAGAELVLDNGGVNADRLLSSAGMTLTGGRLRLLGNATAATSETISAVFGTGTVDLTAPGSFGTTLHLASSLGTMLVHAANLGGAAGTNFTRIVCDTNGPSTALQPTVVIDSSPTGTGEFFAVYSYTSDGAGVIGYRAMRASEYTAGTLIQNVANGGTTPVGQFVATGDVTAAGTTNALQSLTLSGNLTLDPGQTLSISSGGILARAAAAPTTISGGTLAFSNVVGGSPAILYTGGEVTLTSKITGGLGFTKSGPGLLVFDGTAAYTGGTKVAAGTLRASAGDPLASQVVDINTGATLTFAASTSAQVGGLSGAGTVVAPAILTLGNTGLSSSFNGKFLGTVDLVLNDGGNPATAHYFGGAGPFAGTVTMNGGQLSFNTPAPFGSTPIVINGGALRDGVIIASTLQMHTDIVALGFSPVIFGPKATVTGNYNVWVRGSGGLEVQMPLAQTGVVRTLHSPEYDFDFSAPSPGTIIASGAQGSLLQVSAVQLTGGGLKLDYTTAFTGGANGRLGDTTPVDLSGATLSLTGNSTAAITESVGAVSSAGYSTVAITPATAVITTLLPASLSRTDRGTFLLSATTGTLGTSAASNSGKLKLPAAPALIGAGGTLAATSIVPWAITVVGSTYNLATYDANGFRPLAFNEYSALAGAAPTANVLLSATTFSATQTFNSLTFSGTVPSLSGATKLTITSGVILHPVAATSIETVIQPDLEFGAAEAQFFLPTAAPLTVRGVIFGSGGLTKSGPGNLTLSAQNSFTGPVTINGGSLTVANMSGLGAGTSPITLNGTGASLVFSSSGQTLSRPLRLGGGLSTLSGTSLTVDIPISGPGGLYVVGSVILPAGNTFGGPVINRGTLTIADDSSLGASSAFFFGTISGSGTPTLRLNGDWVTSRLIEFQSQSTQTSVAINTNGHQATLNGKLLDNDLVSLQKTGDGTLTLTSASSFGRGLTVTGGAFRLSGAGSLAVSTYTIGGDGLILDNTTIAGSNRIPDVSALTVTSNVSLLGNATTAVTEAIGSLNISGTNTITLSAPGNAATILRANTLTRSGTLFVRGDQLGGGPTGGFTRLTINTPPTAFTFLASTSSMGGPYALGVYDTASDAAGVIGFRQLRAAEYTSDAEIRNPADGGTTPLTANMRVDSVTTVGTSAATVNSLTFAGASSLTLGGGQTLALQTAGVVVEPGSNALISGGTISFPSGGPLLHTEGDLTLRSTLGASIFRKSGPGQLFFEPATAPSGSFSVLEGMVRVGPNDPLSKLAVTLSVGTVLDFASRPASLGSLTSAGVVLLGSSTLKVAGAVTITGGDIAGSGGLELRGVSTIPVPLSVTGPISVIGNYLATSPRVNLTLAGNGTLLGATSLTALGQSIVSLSDSTTALNRFGTIPVTLNGSDLTLTGHAATPVSRSFDVLTATGALLLTTDAVGRQPVELGFSGFVRQDRATLLFYAGGDAFNLGPLVGEGQATVTLGSAPAAALVGANTTATNRPIVPFFWSRQGIGASGSTFVTYDPVTGVRALRSTEYSSSLTAGDNVILSSFPAQNGDFTINSLIVETYGLSGTGTLTVTSGAVMGRYSVGISKNLAFGAAEAVFFSSGSSSTFSISGAISGSGGLTKTGTESLSLSGANTFTGPLTVNQGTLSFSNAGNLGLDTSSIVLNDATLAYTGTDLTLERGIRINGFSRATVAGPSSPNTLMLGAPVTGTGVFGITGRVKFTVPNTFAGDLTVAGTLTFGGDAMLGGGSNVVLGGGSLILAAPWTTNRILQLSGTNSIDTAAFDASIATITSGSSFTVALTKNGAGLLTIADATGYFGGLTVAAGEVQLDGALPTGGSSPGSLAVSAGAILSGSLQGTRVLSVSGTLSPGDDIGAMATGSLSFQSNATFALEIASPASYDHVSVTGTVTLTGPVQLTLDLGSNPTSWINDFTIIDNDGTDAVSFVSGGRFTYAGTTLNEGTHFQAGGQELIISYAGGTGNDVVLSAVPEPASAAFLLLGGLALATWRRRAH